MPLTADDETQICPYNKNHVILKARFGNHLLRCRRQYPNTTVKICRYNSLHHITLEEGIDTHEEVCPSREIFDNMKYLSLIKPPEPVKQDKSLFTEESWDDVDEGAAGYDPSAKMKVMGHARQINYLSKGERKYWRDQERLRLQSLAEEQNQSKREASVVNRRPEKADEEDDTVHAPSSYDQFIDENLS